MSGPQAQFFEFLQQGRFMLQRIKNSNAYVFFPREFAGAADDWEWVEASGHGEVYSRTTIRQKPERGGDYCIAIVELAEGPRLMTRILGIPPVDVAIGMQVEAAVETPDWNPQGGPVVTFHPATQHGSFRRAP
jgi:uncharacterized OB-fold protein